MPLHESDVLTLSLRHTSRDGETTTVKKATWKPEKTALIICDMWDDHWCRQIELIELKEGDALTDNGQETYNLLAARGIENVILWGVHLNMCILGRPFVIRQMVRLGKNVALMRDMTDTMYNPERATEVDHFTGTDLVVTHVEKPWCPSFASSDLTGRKAFRFAEDRRNTENQ